MDRKTAHYEHRRAHPTQARRRRDESHEFLRLSSRDVEELLSEMRSTSTGVAQTVASQIARTRYEY